MGEGFVDRFGPVSGDYAAFRPTYPDALFDWLASVINQAGLAWDCATGTGQAAIPLAARFERVVATDASDDQIAGAPTVANIEFRVAPAHKSGLPDASVDLVTVAQALHWFDVDRFFAECQRVLKPGGVLAVWTYGPLHVAGQTVDSVVQRYYHEIVGSWWPPERKLVDSGYRSISLPFPEFETPEFQMDAWWTLRELLGYLGTWSATTAYRDAMHSDPREIIENSLARAWRDSEGERQVVWPLTVRACRLTRSNKRTKPTAEAPCHAEDA